MSSSATNDPEGDYSAIKGQYHIGMAGRGVSINFTIEAKCYAEVVAVGAHDLYRLISRLRHYQFGVLFTTSYIEPQVYQEMREDQHPIIVITGRDIVQLLISNGLGDQNDLMNWLQTAFPVVQ